MAHLGLSKSAKHAVNCAIYLGFILTWSHNGTIPVFVSPTRVTLDTGIPEDDQVAVRNTLRRAGLLRAEARDGGFLLALGGDGGLHAGRAKLKLADACDRDGCERTATVFYGGNAWAMCAEHAIEMMKEASHVPCA